MKKTGAGIEDDVITAIEDSELVKAISGLIYKEGSRPLNSPDEDAVVSFLAGIDGQYQDGIVIVNVFVPDLDNGTGVKVKNTARCGELEQIAQNTVSSISPTSEYLFSLDAMIRTYKADDADQHFVNVRLRFKRKSF